MKFTLTLLTILVLLFLIGSVASALLQSMQAAREARLQTELRLNMLEWDATVSERRISELEQTRRTGDQ
jgi:type II secretory pathway pseudopilin PulG